MSDAIHPRLNHCAFVRSGPGATVMAALEAARPGASRYVGGCVRDALFGRTPGDIDIATQLLPEAVAVAVKAAGLRCVPTGIAYGTVTVVCDGSPVEVTTLRRDVRTDGRRAIVAYTDDWAEDAARRDFRVNALYCEPDGTIHDPTGGGLADAAARRFVFVGDPATRIEEDALRILRFFRFNAWHAKGPPDPDGLKACGEGAALLAALSVERVWMELKKMLAAPDPSAAVSAMAACGVLAAALPEADGIARLHRLADIENSVFLDTDPMQRLMALLPREPEPAAGLAARLKMSTAERERLARWSGDTTRIVSFLSAREVRAALYWMGRELYLDRVRLAWAEDSEPRRASQWRAMIALENGFVAPKFPLDGKAVAAAGARPGPAVGAILREVEQWWVANDFIDDELSLIERLKAVTQALG